MNYENRREYLRLRTISASEKHLMSVDRTCKHLDLYTGYQQVDGMNCASDYPREYPLPRSALIRGGWAQSDVTARNLLRRREMCMSSALPPSLRFPLPIITAMSASRGTLAPRIRSNMDRSWYWIGVRSTDRSSAVNRRGVHEMVRASAKAHFGCTSLRSLYRSSAALHPSPMRSSQIPSGTASNRADGPTARTGSGNGRGLMSRRCPIGMKRTPSPESSRDFSAALPTSASTNVQTGSGSRASRMRSREYSSASTTRTLMEEPGGAPELRGRGRLFLKLLLEGFQL